MKNINYYLLFIIIISFSAKSIAVMKIPDGHREHQVGYELNFPALMNGEYQYFYCLLKQTKAGHFENHTATEPVSNTKEIMEIFLPLDIKNDWNPSENNYLALAKFNYILPTDIKNIKAEKLSTVEYIQKTLPQYKVTKSQNNYHVEGSFLTPDFNFTLDFLEYDHSLIPSLKEVDREKMKSGKIKVSYMYQNHFGQVMLFQTAKMATAVIIYQEYKKNQTLVTQYILSNIINVPTKSLIRKGMIENLQNVINGTRSAVKDYVKY